MKFRILTIVLLATTTASLLAQEKIDTVVVPLARTSQVIFTIKDHADIETLRHYNFQALFDDVLRRLSEADSTASPSDTSAQPAEENWRTTDENTTITKDEDEDDEEWDRKVKAKRRPRAWQTMNIDLGTNNLMADDQFVSDDELYSVRPWGSWYVGLNSVHRTRVARKFFLEWSWGFSWYNFKFEHDNVMITKDENGVNFIEDTRDVDHIKSKLGATHINTALVPMLDFSDRIHKRRVWDGYGAQFRIGVGPYVGYRLASKSKLVYEEDGDKEKDKDRDRYYLNNLRYGLRLQLGIRSTDFFVNYDLNELFQDNKGPKVNAVSFGLIF